MSRSSHPLNTVVSFFIAGLGLLLMAAPASAQGAGARAGLSVDPDQFYLGGHYESGPIIDRVHFRPNLEIGFGDDLTTLAVNVEGIYKIGTSGALSFYAGGGPAINIFSFDDDVFGDIDSETEAGLNVLFGAETERGLFFEVKLGVFDSPDLKFGVGYTWR